MVDIADGQRASPPLQGAAAASTAGPPGEADTASGGLIGGPSPAFLAVHLVGASVCWASGFLFIKLAPSVPIIALSAARGLLAVAVMAAVFLWMRRSLMPARHELVPWLILGAVNGWVPNVLTAYAMTEITAAQGSMIQASGPLIVAVLAHMAFADERLSGRRIVGVLIGFAGMALLTGPAAFGHGAASARGIAAMLAVSLCYSAGSLYIRSIPVAEPARLAFGQQLFSAVPALVLSLAIEGGAGFAAVPGSLAAVLALGIVATALPNLLYMRLIRAAGPTRASMVGYLLPVWAALMGVMILGERVGLREVVAGAIILAGVFLVTGRSRPGR
jgi:drug/metabolite transporter (DMT)-like permease